MSESMVERVARAMCDGNWDAANFNETASGETPEEQREYWLEKARAAIEAMREPTEAMLEAGARGSGEDSEAVASGVWEAMIDAALKP